MKNYTIFADGVEVELENLYDDNENNVSSLLLDHTSTEIIELINNQRFYIDENYSAIPALIKVEKI